MRDLLRSDGVARELHRRMVAVRSAAVGARDDTYEYEKSLEVVDDLTRDRARSRVVADVPYALAREARDRTLGRAMDAAGD
jgi:hypothetical protein